MRPKRHPSATTTLRMRREVQESGQSNRALAKELGVNRKTIAKWKHRSETSDVAMGPKRPVSTSLTFAEEALIVVFRKHTRLTLDQSLICLKQVIPTLSRSALQRCLVRYRINRLRNVVAWRDYPPSIWRCQQLFKIQVHFLAKGYLYTAINEEGLVFAQSFYDLGAHTAADFLCNAAASFQIGAVRTNDHSAFTDVTHVWDSKWPHLEHPFHEYCRRKSIPHYVDKIGKNESMAIEKGW
jgi:transposase-like protein